MSTKEQIKEFRLARNCSFNPRCVVCGSQYWTSYYGNFGCKKCIRFFLRCVILRKTYKCKYSSGNCRNVYFSAITCKFCYLERMYSYGFRPTRFGRHDDSWYMKEKISSLHPVPVIEYAMLSFLSDLRRPVRAREDYFMLVSYINDLMSDSMDWLNDNAPPFGVLHRNLENDEYRYYLYNALRMKIIKEALHLHDVVKFGFAYRDPYKLRFNFIQSFSLYILNKSRNLLHFTGDEEMNIKIQRLFVYDAEVAW
ncbi:uncharacterized protein LOC111633807 [Centruroides sculpturatus]|uniref:uncharacterized protein LOC111633807 n=1 Tax=Centruroides sculpturatus TaxID=218467 RepID=UPI000C6D37CE|nr:uncharacterized protein LOC111633807 [Centruroides sculpturatus]